MAFDTFQSLKNYNLSTARSDLMAGLIVAVMLIPQGMAYALLAGLPPIYGLYAGLVPLFIYPIFGSSRFLSVGPAALMALIIYSGLSKIAPPMSSEFISLAILTALIAGIIQVLLSVIKMGYLVNFLSQPVIRGFTSAAAFIIVASQLKHLFGIEAQRTGSTLTNMAEIVLQFLTLDTVTMVFGTVALAFILWVKITGKNLPASLLMVVLSSFLVYIFRLEYTDLAIIGEVPKGLPAFEIPDLNWTQIQQVIPIALIVCLVSFIESLSIAKVIAARQSNDPISGNKELWALGWAKIVGSFFQAFPSTGSFSRSALNAEAGANTGMASIWTAIFTGLTLLFFTDWFFYVPQSVLAAIVIASVVDLVDVKRARFLFEKDRKDFYVFLFTLSFTLIFGILEGVLAGVILSLIFILYKASRPHYTELGALPESAIYKSVERYDEAETRQEYLIFRYDDDLFFANAEHFYESVVRESRKKNGLKVVIIDASSIGTIDSTGMEQLKLLKKAADKAGIELFFTGVKGPVRDIFDRYDFFEVLPRENFFLNIDVAISHLQNKKAQSLPKPEKVKDDMPKQK